VDVDQTKTSAGTIPGNPVFIRDGNGRTLFYAGGPRHRGYVVPDAQLEWALRDAAQQFKTIDTILGWVLVAPLLVSLSAIGGPHADSALAALTATLATAVIGKILQRRWFFGELIAGLDCVEPIDVVGRRREFIVLTLLAVGYLSFVAWRVWETMRYNPH
jgi:hypothetical protein